jgi:NADP-dependent 3-hydroxy acid dehydrogenase YdfG
MFITGAASGLGLELCAQLAPEGWTIGMADLRGEMLEKAVAEIGNRGATVHPYVFDVTSRPAFQQAVDAFAETAGGLDLFVNNAGVAGGGPMGEYALEDWDWLLGINLMGVVNGCHFAVPHMKRQQGGHLINIASAAAFVPVPGMAAYCAAKAGVKMVSEVLFNELHDDNVRVSVAMPEFFRTNLHERTRGPLADEARFLITQSPYTAEEVAIAILEGAAAGHLHIVFGREAHLLWRWLRWLPMRTMAKIRTVRKQREEKLRRRVARMVLEEQQREASSVEQRSD